MPSGVFKPYAGVSTAILIFTKTNAGGTDRVWFYDMAADGFSLDDKRSPIADNDIPDVVARFHGRNRGVSAAEPDGQGTAGGRAGSMSPPQDERTGKSFFVDKVEIAANDYDLSVNKHKKTEYVAETFPPTAEILGEIDALAKEFEAGMKALSALCVYHEGWKWTFDLVGAAPRAVRVAGETI